MARWLVLLILLVAAMFVPLRANQFGLKVGSKAFTESVILGELLTQLARSSGQQTEHIDQIGGTSQLFQSLLVGDIDIYPDYTGTIQLELLANEQPKDWQDAANILAKRDILVSPPIGFNNGYAIGMKRSRAEKLGIKTVSDLSRHPDLKFGFSNEFVTRADCWPGLRTRYGLPQNDVRGMEHGLAYRQLASADIDAMDVYTTDAKIALLDIVLLQDDLNFFPAYQAVLLYRSDLPRRFPKALDAMQQLVGTINESTMTGLNLRADVDTTTESVIAAEYLKQAFEIDTVVQEESLYSRAWKYTLEHIDLVRKSLIPAIIVGVLLGLLADQRRQLGQVVLGITGIIQTIPALALLVLLLPVVGMLKVGNTNAGLITAYVALFLYSLLPIVRNTFTGLSSIDRSYLESAAALGLPDRVALQKIRFPLAMRSIIAGIKTAAIQNIGFATLGALIGAGGYGEPVLTGIRRFDTYEILLGAIPAALMALLCQAIFELLERRIVSKGLR
jgi:osmoprotectant transport system permease protein